MVLGMKVGLKSKLSSAGTEPIGLDLDRWWCWFGVLRFRFWLQRKKKKEEPNE